MIALQRRLGPSPRVVSAELAQQLALPAPPAWLGDGDALSLIYDNHEAIVRHGALALASVVMANQSLWEPGDNDAPASVVYTFDPVLQGMPERLVAAGSAIYGYHQSEAEPPLDPWRRLLLDRLHSGLERTMHQRLPPEHTGGFVVYESSVMLCRDHLPDRVLSQRFLPVLVLREGQGPHPAFVVPAALWGERFSA